MSTGHPTLRAPTAGDGPSRLTPRLSASTVATRPGAFPPGPPDPIALEPGHEIGRFTVLSYLGAGMMGIVYAAYDPELDRKVALKVLRRQGAPDSHGRLRLHDEAQAMAKVSHPNVAVVHEVGLHEDGIFIAMEFIRGETLQAWRSRKPRPWTEVLDAFIQAGRGLAAAHQAGLIHRDFKPSNAMIGDDGRVRVLDFGLSCTPSRAGREVVGTPAYMPPEQFLGHAVGPASDQFSFCASLYEALFGQLPFPGESADELRLTITSGQVRSPPRHVRVPSWLTAAILRGLKQEPRDRFPTMEDLLRALDHRRGRNRRTLLAAVAAATVLGIGGGYLSARGAGGDQCSGGSEEIAAVWNDDVRAALGRTFHALPAAFRDEVWPQLDHELSRHARVWVDHYRHACQTRLRGELTDELFTRSQACLDRTRSALAEAIVVLREADEEVALRALEVAHGVPNPALCTNPVALSSQAALPRDPAVLARLRTILERLERVRVFARAGRNAEAVHLADAVVREAHDLQYRPVLAEALLQRGRLDLLHQPSKADGPLTEAYLTALGAGDDSRAAEALALRMYARGRSQGALSRGLEDLAVVKELLNRLDAPPQHLRGLIANNAGAMFLAAGDPARAEPLFVEALSLYKASLGEEHVEVGHTLSNLAILATDPDRREELLGRALHIFQSQLGQAHPDTLEAMFVAGTLMRDPRDAVELIHDACTTLADYRPDDGPQRARCLLHLATHAREVGEHQLVRDALHEARELVADIEPDSAETLTYTALIRGYAALADGEHADAIVDLREARQQLPAREWWEREMHASLDVCLGAHLLAVGAAAEARAVLDHSLAEFATVTDKTRDALIPRTIALANLTLAEALVADHEPRLAVAALDVAESWYRAAGDGFAWRLPQIAALREVLGQTAAAPSHPPVVSPAPAPPAALP